MPVENTLVETFDSLTENRYFSCRYFSCSVQGCEELTIARDRDSVELAHSCLSSGVMESLKRSGALLQVR